MLTADKNSPASTTVFLVSCVGQKRSSPAPARDLYVSSWFWKARTYVESTGSPWFILSAEHGLISPDQVIAPYERTLNHMPKPARQMWAARVKDQMQALMPTAATEIVILAGTRYREFLMDDLK